MAFTKELQRKTLIFALKRSNRSLMKLPLTVTHRDKYNLSILSRCERSLRATSVRSTPKVVTFGNLLSRTWYAGSKLPVQN